MTLEAFVAEVLPYAQTAAARVGFWPSVVIAQWANETGDGTSPYWAEGHNPAGISPGGKVAAYPSVSAGVAAYIGTALDGLYDGVRAARPSGALVQALALGRSPWAESHYVGEGSSTPGSALVNSIIENHLQEYDGAEPEPGPEPAPAPAPNPQPMEAVYMIPTNCTDGGAFAAQVREWWTTYRSDLMTVADQADYWEAFHLATAQGGFAGNPDLVLARIIDTAGANLRPQFAGAA